MKKDDIRTFVVIIIICTLITGLVLFLNRKSNSDKLEVVDEYNNFFTITNYVNNYLEYSSTYNASKLYDVLYSDYIDSKGITINNLFDYLKEYSIDTSVEVNKIEYVSVKNNYIYYIQGKLNEMTFDTTNVIDNDFRIDKLDKNFKFTLNDSANIVEWTAKADLKQVPTQDLSGYLPEYLFDTMGVVPDFEKMVED